MEGGKGYEDALFECHRIISKNEKITSKSEAFESKRYSSVYTDECLKEEDRKIILYNIRYTEGGDLRSDIDIIDEYNQLMCAEEKVSEYEEALTKELTELNSPGTLERVSRTFTSWILSDTPRKERILRRKNIQNKLKEIQDVLCNVKTQIPLYKAVVSITTTTEIHIKSSKLKSKYAHKIKGKKHKSIKS